MKTENRYLKFVQWNEADNCYVGHCPDLFPWGGVCHGQTEEETYAVENGVSQSSNRSKIKTR